MKRSISLLPIIFITALIFIVTACDTANAPDPGSQPQLKETPTPAPQEKIRTLNTPAPGSQPQLKEKSAPAPQKQARTLQEFLNQGAQPTKNQKKPPFTFKLSTFNGETLDIAKMKGSPVVINFWGSWCTPCRLEANDFEDAYQDYKAQGVKFIGVAVQDTKKNAKAFIKQYGISYPNGLDKNDEIGIAQSVFVVPMTIILDREGEVVLRHPGVISRKALNRAIEDILNKK